MGEIGSIFQRSVTRRPLKLKVMPFKCFTLTPVDNPFAQVDGSIAFDFEVGASFKLPGVDPPMGSVIMSCIEQEKNVRVLLTSTGNMRGRIASNSLMNHVLARFQAADSTIEVDRYTGRR